MKSKKELAIISTIIPLLLLVSSVAVAGADQTACFNRLDDYFKERLKHINDTDFTVIFPCPEMNKSAIPEDESGK